MRKVLIIYGVLVLGIIIIAVLRFRGVNLLPNINLGGNDAKVTIEDDTFEVEVADDDAERIKGLSDRDNLDENKGMVFVFEEKGKYGFWMRNVKFPLDIIYISDNKIVDIFANTAPQAEDAENIPVFEPKENANFVLEINGGKAKELGIDVGDEVVFEGIN